MYLPTFWKMYAEAFMHKGMKAAGWGLPAGCMGKSPNRRSKLEKWRQTASLIAIALAFH